MAVTATATNRHSCNDFMLRRGLVKDRYRWYLMVMTRDELQALRAKLGLTQPELAEKVGVARNTINRWEMGIRRIPEPVVRLLDYLTKEVREEQKSKTTRKATGRQAKKGSAS